MTQRLFEPSMFLGVAVLAVWVYVRLPHLKPKTLRAAAVHVLLSIATFSIAPIPVRATVHTLPLPLSVIVAIGAITIPALCYVLLSWVWFIARVIDAGTSTPRGGHPASALR
jgi:ABC-type spermidine/putrescine transport system permease subunit II